MHTSYENNKIIIYLEGNLDSNNAGEISDALDGIIKENPEYDPVIDAGELQYISSSGLRVLLRVAKGQSRPLVVRSVTPEIYEILEVTGFTEILEVHRKLREISLDGCAIIGQGAQGTVYRLDADTVVKVYDHPDSLPLIENERELSRKAFLSGIPTAISYDIVKVGDQYGAVYEMLRATTYSDLLKEHPEQKEDIVRKYAYFIRDFHKTELKQGQLPEAKAVFLKYLDQLRHLLEEDLYSRLYDLFEAMPENYHAIHGDIQMKNIMLSGEESLLIDMETLSVGDPVFDLMSLYITYVLFNEDDPDDTRTFLGMTDEMSRFVWEKTLEYYFDDRDKRTTAEAEKKIRVAACIRFLFQTVILELGKPEFRQVRIHRALTYLADLVGQVDSLAIG